MSECAWVARIEDKETSIKGFRYDSFATMDQAKSALQKSIQLIANVIEVSNNPYAFKSNSRSYF